MDADESVKSLETVHLLQASRKEKTPPQNPRMDERRFSLRIKERQNQEKKQILSRKCLTDASEVTRSRRAMKRQRSDSEEDENGQQMKTKRFNGNDKTALPGYREGLSEYELDRLENIRQNQAFLHSLKLPQISLALRPKPKPNPKSLNLKEKTEMPPVRKSLRLQNKDVQTPLTLEFAAIVDKEPEEMLEKPPGPIPLDPLNLEELPEDLLNIWNEGSIKQKTETSDLNLYKKILKKMRLDDRGPVKVVKNRIFSAAFHPASSNLLMAAGNRWGQLGLLKMGADWVNNGVFLFEPHSKPITCMAFTSQPSSLITVSYDGSARSMDLEKAVFDEVYRSASELKSFAFMSSDCSTLLITDLDGDLAVVDRRTPGTSYESLYTMDPKALRCVHVHPVQQQYFVVAGSSVDIYDLRYLKRKDNQAVCELNGHTRSISSAYFSPFSGNRVVTACMDDTIRVFNTSEMVDRAHLLSSVWHNMKTGRWLSRLSAVWDPKQENCFVIGNMDRCRKIQVYHESGRLLHSFQHEQLTTVCSITAFHPSRNALLGGNASGRLHVFSDQH